MQEPVLCIVKKSQRLRKRQQAEAAEAAAPAVPVARSEQDRHDGAFEASFMKEAPVVSHTTLLVVAGSITFTPERKRM